MLRIFEAWSICLLAAMVCTGCERAVIRAAADGDFEQVTSWVEGGGNVNVTSVDGGVTPLHHAAGANHLKMAEYLLENGADFTLKGTGCGTPLQWAARAGHVEMARLILGHGADINDTGPNGSTSLHDAAGGGHVKMVEFLLSKGADVNAAGDYGMTPLHAAVYRDQARTAGILLDHDADTAAQVNGRTARQIAKSNELAQLLGEPGTSQ